MYPQCRHVRPSGENCRAASIKGSHWCYFHLRLHQRQAQRNLHRQRDKSGRFTPANYAPSSHPVDARPRQLPSPGDSPADRDMEAAAPQATALPAPSSLLPDGNTWDYGSIPVNQPASPENPPLALSPIEDSASIQLALIDVLQALAANQLDPKRAGLLLYGLQVASSNAKNVFIHSNGIRSITYTEDGIPLAPQNYGWDIEDIEEADDEEEEE